MSRATRGRGDAAPPRSFSEDIDRRTSGDLSPALRRKLARALPEMVRPIIYAVGQADRISHLDPLGALVHLGAARHAIDVALMQGFSIVKRR
jgi:hypothetical protein